MKNDWQDIDVSGCRLLIDGKWEPLTDSKIRFICYCVNQHDYFIQEILRLMNENQDLKNKYESEEK